LARRRTQLRHRRCTAWRVAVFNPLVEIPRGKAANVRSDVGRGANQAAKADELVRTEPVRIEPLGPRRRLTARSGARVRPEVGAARAVVGRADSVAPVIAVGEAAAWPPDDWRLDLFHLVDERLADPIDVRNLRVLADPDAVVDDAAEVLGEMAVQLRVDGANRLVDQNFQTRVGGLRANRRHASADRARCRTRRRSA